MAEDANIDLSTVPALAPPPGQVSNLKDPYSLRHYMYITASLGLGLSTAAVLLRVFIKARVMRFMQLEEYILILSQIGFYVFTGLMIHAVHLGQGIHQWNVSVAHVQKVIELANIIEIIYCPVILGAKVAMLLQMRRMFVVNKTGKLYWLHEILLWTNVPCYLALMLSFAFACVPREKLWNPKLPGQCVSSTAILIASSTLNVLSDLTMLLLPLVVVMRLQLPPRSKLILNVVFGTGILTCVSSTCRLVYGVYLTRTEDFTWGIAPIGLWAIGEICTVILSGAIPLLPGFVKFVRGQGKSQSGPSLPRSGSRWPSQNMTGSKGRPLPSEDGGKPDNYYPLDATSEAHVSAAALLAPEKDSIPLGIMKTVHVQTDFRTV
ncbi:hypothetical protein IFM46972_06006 [Aspergillus udagawae]|uniref:Rhodopsin domain-containing protein n=1 Tax=Aspergillus udagawae TaxID=91492 RepID=A0A8H3NYN4_9EURO|nr:hypothetical protein IFM46972_06006 [Aspergillus udagawae]